ncbi:MAG: alpha/beta hydrolase, partial [Pseudomonadota bacterium]|nr:alpha/beta hydrolase [Pseudomonadota bacterium]
MFVVTNRRLITNKTGLEQFGNKPNPEGPNELRIVEVARENSGWKVEILPDRLDEKRKRAVGLPVSKPAVASQYAARIILKRVQQDKRNVLFFVHGYNNNMGAVLERAQGLADTFNLEVIPFSWPADGGGIRGTLSYLSD